MRIADSTFFVRMRNALTSRRSDLATAQQIAESGIRAGAPSDDPLAVSMARKQYGAEQRHAAYQRGTDSVQAKLGVADSALEQVHNALVQAHDLSIQAANDTLTATDRQTIAAQITQIRAQVLEIANTEQGGHYVFAGYKDNAPAFDAAGIYQGDANVQKLEVAPGVLLSTGITGDQVFAPAGGTNVFTSLDNLQTALANNDTVGIQQGIADLGAAVGQIADRRAQLGGLMQSADMAKAVAQQAQDRATARRSQLVEADAVQAYSDVTKAQSALQAAVTIAAQLPPPGLVNERR